MAFPTPRRELLLDIDLSVPRYSQQIEKSPFDTRITAAYRVEEWKVITGHPGIFFLLYTT